MSDMLVGMLLDATGPKDAAAEALSETEGACEAALATAGGDA
jgi:hypothetical protein